MIENETPCASCGGPLPDVRFATTTTCPFCARAQPNPRPLPVGHEVVKDGHLDVVVECRGPDEISLRRGTETIAARLVELVPVVLAAEAIVPGTSVFVLEHGEWRPRFVRTVEGETVKVISEHASFRDPFFDEVIPLERVRVRVGLDAPKRLDERTLRPRNLFDIVFKAIFAIILLPFVAFGLVFAWGFVRALFRAATG